MSEVFKPFAGRRLRSDAAPSYDRMALESDAIPGNGSNLEVNLGNPNLEVNLGNPLFDHARVHREVEPPPHLLAAREGLIAVRLPPSLRTIPSHSRRMRRQFRRRQVPKVRLTLLIALFFVILSAFLSISIPQQTPLNYFLSLVWSMYAPLAVIGVIGSVYLTHLYRPEHRVRPTESSASRTKRCGRLRSTSRSSFEGRTDKLLIVTVPTLLAKGNLPALQRVLLSLLINLPRHFEQFRIDVVTEGAAGPLEGWLEELGSSAAHIRILRVPSKYETPNGSRFKTRANQFAMEARRAASENTESTYVYHLDDDTHIGEDTAASLAEFIVVKGKRFLLAQGILSFPHHLTPSTFCRLADSIRPADDLTRFAFFTGMLGTPLGGLHGEHLIVRADIEDEIGWDFPNTVIEDAYFAIQFSDRYPRQSTMLNSYSYGASPASVSDLVRQRRRWIEGLLRLAFNRQLPKLMKVPLVYSIFTWSLAPFQFVGLALLISYATGVDNTSPISPWFLPLWSLSLAYVFWQYVEGLKVNISASDRPHSFVMYAIVLIPSIYVITAVETFAAILGIVRFLGVGSQKVSEVITKPV